jgi:protein-disulfide isomerase
MKNRILAAAVAAVALASASAFTSASASVVFAQTEAARKKSGPSSAQKASAQKSAAPNAAVDAAAVQAYLAKWLPWDPESRVTAEKSADRIPGMQGWKITRKGRYEKLNVDKKTVYVSDDGKWFFGGDTLPNANPRPVRSAADLSWLEEKFSELFRSKVRVQLVPERDAVSGAYKAIGIGVETGYFPVRMPGYVSADGRVFLQGTMWDFQLDPREEKRRRIDLSLNRASGPASATVNMVEFADMECGYCKFRGLQMDRLLEANAGIVNVRRHYKFFPLFFNHVWAMKAASAGECIVRFAGPAPFFKFKEQVYGRQESMTVSGIDELAVTAAEASGVSSADFLSCYLQEQSFARIRSEIEEGYRLGVNSTPTYFIDGTEISWVEDKVMEDFLRTLFPKMKSITYGVPGGH